MARTSAITDEHGQDRYVGQGAVRQQGPLKLMACNECHGEVVWCKSKRTGKPYLVNVSYGYLGQR